jgi:hypothetical protein
MVQRGRRGCTREKCTCSQLNQVSARVEKRGELEGFEDRKLCMHIDSTTKRCANDDALV